MSRHISPRTTLDSLKKEAKRWLAALRAGDAAAQARLRRALAVAPAAPVLRDVQHAIAREFGLPGWAALRSLLRTNPALSRYDAVAEALVAMYRTGDAGALRIVWEYFGHMRTLETTRRYIRLDLGRTETPAGADDDVVGIEDARWLVARRQGFDSWEALATFVAEAGSHALMAQPMAVYASTDDRSIEHARRTRDRDELLACLGEGSAPGINANGQMTDALLRDVARFEHVSVLDLGGSRALTDAGLLHLARLPNLRHLDLSGCAITDSGLRVLRDLPQLESISLGGTRITDAGAAELRHCGHLQRVDLGGTRTGDGAIGALAGKAALRELRSGDAVTDAGLPLLHDLPMFRTWSGGAVEMALLRPDAHPSFLSLRGTFSDDGLARLVGLDGLVALDLDNGQLAVTGRGLAPLVALPHLAWLGFDADDADMPYIAALPHLRFLMCQDTAAGDDGFVALSASRSIEFIWGRRCYNLRRRGFVALSTMPRLMHLSVSCRNVDDAGLSVLPEFPALRELMPMDVPDDGYRHIGRCPHVEKLVLMYCRDTTDAATAHITALSSLRSYFASYTRITDATPRLLATMDPLEEVTFDSCAGLTDAGIAALARLPRLRELAVGGMRNVSADIGAAFPPHVHVRHTM